MTNAHTSMCVQQYPCYIFNFKSLVIQDIDSSPIIHIHIQFHSNPKINHILRYLLVANVRVLPSLPRLIASEKIFQYMRHSKHLGNEHCKKFKNESIYDFCKLGDEFVLQPLLLLYKMHSYPYYLP